ncbi:MAG: penicillin-binding protein activator, partial [Deltaproteobacteria bacterium]|nr:penicillin-binding protein activator [Deltaproteobacteria bacterium]
MKPSHIIAIILSAALLIWACVPKPDVVPGMPGEQNADELFSSAEKQFEVQSYDQALVLYTEYFRRFADKPMAAAVLMKIGIIHALAGEYEKARSAFQKILSEYPDSSVVPDALVEELFTYYQQGRYQEVIDLAPEILGRIDSRAHISKTYMLMGDTFMAAGSPIDAVDYYARSQRFATELEQQTITEKLKEAIAHLESADIAVLLKHADESLPMDFLLFQLGLNYSMEERYDDALAKLTEFVIKYPEHDNRMLAVSLIDEIKKNAVFNRFTVGCLLPLSGDYQSFGQRALKGIELALAQFSSQNENPPINIIIRDTGADPNKTVAALNELYHQQVAAILGPIVTSEIAAREAQLMGVPIITLTQKDNIPEIGDNVFRNFITPKMQVQALASFTVESLGLNRFAILYPDETYGLTFMNLFWDELIELGGMVVGVEAYNPKQTDYTDPIKKLVGLYYEVPEDLKPIDDLAPEPANEEELKQAEAKDEEIGAEEAQAEEEPESIVDFDAIFIPDSPGKAGQIVPQLAYFDIKDVYMLGTNLWHSDSLIKIAHQYVQGAVFPDGFFAGSASPRVQKFVKSFEETYEETPGYIEAVVYDSAMILFHVVSRPHIRFRSEIRDELLNLDNFQGVT